MNVSVVIPSYNRAHSLRSTLEALRAQVVPKDFSWELIVVNNNSSDETHAVINTAAAVFPVPVHHVFEPRQGINPARNAGIERAKGSIIAFTDDDVLPAPDWVAMIDSAMQRREADVVGGRILAKWEGAVPEWLAASIPLQARLTVMSHDVVTKLTRSTGTPGVWGANMAFRREIFDSGHRFDPARGMVGEKLYRGEECYLIGNLLLQGRTVVYDPALVVWHRIPVERTRRAYFRRINFDVGEGEGRVSTSSSKRQIFGARFYDYRRTVLALASWGAAALCRRHDAFEHELAFLVSLGRLWGLWQRHFARREGKSS
jgi:glucosyl-dolichyl phosphate glucuronosyltransferase